MELISRFKLNYLFIPLFVVITASAASYFADVGRAWYKTINLPQWTPSNSVMVIAWVLIFVLTSLSVLIIWNKYSTQKSFSAIMWLFVLNALLNVGWNILFFTQQQIGLAFFQALLLVVNIVLLIVLIWRFCPFAACLLFPYSLWVGFATALTFNVWMLN
jgi:tryptophan-rich sensory protein